MGKKCVQPVESTVHNKRTLIHFPHRQVNKKGIRQFLPTRYPTLPTMTYTDLYTAKNRYFTDRNQSYTLFPQRLLLLLLFIYKKRKEHA
jgi:hypothetical protein